MTRQATSTQEELENPHAVQRQLREWRWERHGAWGIAAVLVCGMLGLFGDGLLARRTRTSSDGTLQVRYSAFERANAPSQLVIRCRHPQAPAPQLRLRISRSLTDAAPADLTPPPDQVVAEERELIYIFAIDPASEFTEIVYDYQCPHSCRLRYHIASDADARVSVSQFVYP